MVEFKFVYSCTNDCLFFKLITLTCTKSYNNKA